MASSTNRFNLPYPEGPDPVAVPADVQELAEAVDAALTSGLLMSRLVGSGVVAAGELVVAESDPIGLSVVVAPGSAIIPGTGGNVRYLTLAAEESLDIDAGDADPRIDLVVATEDTPNSNAPSISVIKGTPAASPSMPATPSGYIRLASILMGSGASDVSNADITDLRQPYSDSPQSTGEIKMFYGQIPWGFLEADGSAFNTARYSRLFAAPGFGSTLPNVRDRTPVGAGNEYAVGELFGTKEVSLVAAQNGPHSHGDGTLAADSHDHDNGTLAAVSHLHGAGTLVAASHRHGDGTLVAASHLHPHIYHYTPIDSGGGGVRHSAVVLPGSYSTYQVGTQNSGQLDVDGNTDYSGSVGVSGGTASNGADVNGRTSNNSAGVSGQTGSSGSGLAHENRQPSIGVRFAVRV